MAVTYSQNGIIVRGGSEPFSPSNMVNIIPINKIVVVDKHGNIGYDLTNYFQTRGQTYYYNYAILDNTANYSDKGLGTVTFYTPASNNIGGRVYNTVIIGGKEWMAENLDFKFSGLSVGQSGTSSSEPRANYYQNNESTYGADGNKYGLLYNWIAVKYLEDNKSLLIPGWHVPTTAVWDALATADGGTSTAGTKLKSTSGWYDGGNGTDDYGFSGFPAGFYNGSFSVLGTGSVFWMPTKYNNNNAYTRHLGTGTDLLSGDRSISNQYSVRLVKDTNP